MENTADIHKQYQELLLECLDKIMKLAPRKWDVLKKQAKEAIGTLLFIHLLSGEGFDRRILVLILL